MREYRLTRCGMFPMGDALGRNGHYIDATNEHDARAEMCKRYPQDAGWFDCTLWRDDEGLLAVEPESAEGPMHHTGEF